MAQIEFFSTIEDEKKLISQISKDKSIKYSIIENNRFSDWIDLNEIKVPNLYSTFEIYIWKSDLGKINWLKNEPKIDTSTQSRIVKSLFTKEHWKKEKEQNDFDKMINNENSPILYYKRGEQVFDYRLPNLILSPQSSIDYLGHEFKLWFNRITSWIIRNGDLVHNWKMSESKLRNDMSFANSIYALSDAKKMIDCEKHNFAISINTRKFDK